MTCRYIPHTRICIPCTIIWTVKAKSVYTTNMCVNQKSIIYARNGLRSWAIIISQQSFRWPENPARKQYMKSLYKMLIMKAKTQLLLWGYFNRIVCVCLCNFVLSEWCLEYCLTWQFSKWTKFYIILDFNSWLSKSSIIIIPDEDSGFPTFVEWINAKAFNYRMLSEFTALTLISPNS